MRYRSTSARSSSSRRPSSTSVLSWLSTASLAPTRLARRSSVSSRRPFSSPYKGLLVLGNERTGHGFHSGNTSLGLWSCFFVALAWYHGISQGNEYPPDNEKTGIKKRSQMTKSRAVVQNVVFREGVTAQRILRGLGDLAWMRKHCVTVLDLGLWGV